MLDLDDLGAQLGDEAVAVYRDTSYLGSHPALVGQRKPEPADLVVTEEGVLFVRGRRELGGIPWSSVRSIHADDREGVERRVTATRVLLLGALAFVAKKETRLAYLVIADDDGEWVFAVPGMSPPELAAGLRHLQRFVTPTSFPPPVAPAKAPSQAGATDDIPQRLQRLSGLHSSGLITDAEYAQQRAAIIGSV